MTAPSLPEQYREILRLLRGCIDRRLNDERKVAAAREAEDRPRPQQLDETRRKLDEQYAAALAYADEQYRLQHQAIEEQFETASQSVEETHREQTRDVRREYERAAERTEEEYQENRWLMSSLVDDSSDESPKRRFELLQDRLNQANFRIELDSQALNEMQAEAVQILHKRGFAAEPSQVERVAPARNSLEAQSRFSESDEAAQIHFRQLKRQFITHLLSGIRLPLIALAIWLGLGAGGFFLLDRNAVGLGSLDDTTWLVVWAAVGGGVALIFGLTSWFSSKSRSLAAYQAFYQSFSAARQNLQLFEACSARELDEAQQRYELYQKQLVEHRERSLEKFSSERQMTAEQLLHRRDELLRDCDAQRDRALQPLIESRERDLTALDQNHRTYLESLEQHHRAQLAEAEAEFRKRVDARDATLSQLQNELATQWRNGWQQVLAAASEMTAQSQPKCPSWAEIANPDWRPAETVPESLRLGDYVLNLASIEDGLPADDSLTPPEAQITLPALLPFPQAPSLILKYSPEGRRAADEALQTAMLRLLTTLPPSTIRFTVIDPQTLGEPFSAFMHLADYNELLISHRIWTEPAHIDRQLADLTEHMENIFQKYLRNEFATIEDYNRTAGEVAEPYRILVVSGFPRGFSERAAQRLVSIASSGPRCGVYLLLSFDRSQQLPREMETAALEEHGTVLEWSGAAFVNRKLGKCELTCRVDAPPEPALFSAIVKKLGELSLTARKVEVAFSRIAPRPNELWTSDSRRMLDIPLGRAGATKLQHLRLGVGTSQHVLIAGRTGSGKSTLLHVIITNAALHYSPDELQFYLIDFKKGVEFKAYASGRMPHARIIAIESDREFGVSALQRLDAELKTRGDLFREQGVQDVEAFRNANPGTPMPRILLVIDEFQEFFVEDDRLAQTATLLLDRLVRQGRAFGIHVLLGSQTLGGAYSLARTTLSQMAVRIALQCSESDAHLILSEENTAARLLTRPGEAIYNDANGTVEGNSPFQISWLGDDERESHLAAMRKLTRERNIHVEPPVVFEGNIPADLSRNTELIRRLTNPDYAHARVQEESGVTLWLGDPVTIGGLTSVALRPQPGSHLLIVGQDERTARGLLAAVLFAAGAGAAGVDLLDGRAVQGHASTPWDELLQDAPIDVSVCGPQDVAAALDRLSGEIETRKNDPSAARSPLVVCIDDLSQFRDLRKEDDDFSFGRFGSAPAETSPARQFAGLVTDGAAVGVHLVVWCTSYNNVDRWLGRSMLREFESRVVLQMNATDSSNLIDSPAGNRLGPNRALLYRDDSGTIEKFRPYGRPPAGWLSQLEQTADAEQSSGQVETPDDIGDFQIQ